jgi:hypothetical protein
MTLVVRLAISDYPLLLGDVLVSGPETAGSSLVVPTVGAMTNVFPEGSGYVPTDLRQKLAVLGDNLVLGWAGSRIAAKVVTRELLDLNSRRSLTLDSLMRYFDELDSSIWEQGTGFLGFVKDGSGVAQFGRCCYEVPTSLFGRVGLLGSGVPYVEAYLHGNPQIPDLPRALNDLQRSVGVALIASGSFLCHEIATHHTLLHYFGGGYEIASLVEGTFAKIDDVTYLFWYGQIDESGCRFNIHQVCKYSYQGDLLLIRAATFSEPSSATPVLTARPIFTVVPPVYREPTEQELHSVRLPSFDSKWLCNYFMIPRADRDIGVFVHIYYSVEGDAPIRFADNEDFLTIAFRDDFLKSVIKQAYDGYAKEQP